ncbi:prunin 1 Pru du 6.0101-like [Argentina anserina]|uniref:prunin 1 Pru du 6.0101-like n=1 Tax=Argentina anserina TaxID=57926 RepID=UPI0021767BF9|nr:prunin 1 Pru du 6.0101-like [Potentilla anserina]
MAKPVDFAIPLCLVLLNVLFQHGCSADQPQFESIKQNHCQMDQLHAREPDIQIECEAGRIESWDHYQNDFQCAGVASQRVTIEPNGLHLPSYTHSPQLMYIVKGWGVMMTALPGCPETFELSQGSQQTPQERHGFDELERHQKVRFIGEGDIIAIPPGIVHWMHNNGNSPLVAVSLLDIGNDLNQLDRNPRRFYLAGNPEDEFNQQEGEGISQPRRHSGQGSINNNIFAGFNTSILADALNVDIETIMRVQGQNEQTRSQIVRVEGRFGFLHPPIRSSHGQRSQQEQLDEQQGQQERHDNGLGETLCNIALKEYLGDPKRADIYTPQAGRINTLNSNDMPILKHMSLSAETGFLYNNAIYSPHWNHIAHEIFYVIRGSARVQVVNDIGEAILDDEVRKGQLFIVPQNHAVLQKAVDSEGFEYIAFKTQDKAVINTMAGRTSVLRALPDDVLANAYQISQEEARMLKYSRQETVVLSSSRSS